MENRTENIEELSEKLVEGIRSANIKLVKKSAANGDSLVISDNDGQIKMVAAKELLQNLNHQSKTDFA